MDRNHSENNSALCTTKNECLRGGHDLPVFHFSLFSAMLIKLRTKALVQNKIKGINRMDLPAF